ncbi:MAG: ABC transporter ATP-binding protein [Acidimicrobiia bacterium]|nr:ABC transporter ATP-binding protein [Acidimicrobiia bacterium]
MTVTKTTALLAEDVGVSIKDTVLLRNVSLSIDEGSWMSIIGPNGAGKSTLLRALAGSVKPEGRIDIFGQDVQKISGRERAKLVSWVPQTPTIPQGMNVLDYVLLGRTPHLSPLAVPSTADVEIAQNILAELDLSEMSGRTVETLSGGERQRAVIGRALVQEAPILLLDEPTSALDLGHQQEVLRLLDRLRQNSRRTIITTMHDLTLAGQFADQLILLADGGVVAEGSAVSVLTEKHISAYYGAEVHVNRQGNSVLVVPRIDQADSAPFPERAPHSPTNPENSHGN